MADISVIVPLYQGNKYIKQIIEMVEKGSYSMELIFINDYPNEQVEELYSDKIKVRYFYNQENRGIHQSRILGVKKATGSYIHMLDQDDLIEDNFYKTQMETIQDADVVVCNGYYRGKKLIFEKERTEINSKEFYTKGNIIISPGQTLIKRDAISKEWLEDSLQNSGCDDWFLWILMVYNEMDFAYNSEIAYIHVEDGNNQTFHWDKMRDSLKEIRARLEVLSNVDKEQKQQTLKCIDKFIFDYDSFYKFDSEWKCIDKEQLKNYLKINELQTVAIYGYGNIGRKVAKTLQMCGMNVWAIDRDVRYIEEDISIYRPEDKLPSADLIIVTPLRGQDEICQWCEKQLNIKRIISLERVMMEF